MPILSELVESDVENSHDVLDAILTSPSAPPTPPVAKKAAPARKQPKSQKAAAAKAAPKPKAGKDAPAAKRPTTKKAAATKRKATEEPGDEAGQNGEAGDAPETQQPKSRGRGKATQTQPKPACQEERGQEDTVEPPQSPVAASAQPSTSSPAKSTSNTAPAGLVPRPAKRVKTGAKIPVKQAQIPVKQTQQDPEAIAEPGTDADTNLEGALCEPGHGPPEERVRAHNASRRNSRLRQPPVARRRAGSASDTERGEPGLRRKLGEITRKLDQVELKYGSLKEVGINEANANVEKLRQRCEASTLASNQLIASLKKELAAQAPLAHEARKIKAQMHSQDAEMAKVRSSATELAACLAAAQNEIKALQAKLAASRASAVAAEGRTPAQECKREARAPLVPASEAAQVAQMKEELYSDLTGLIVRSVKRSADGDTYDCIQTGRNGTLHFKLFVDAEDAKNATFEDTDFLYTPLLDPNRDRDMIELMPTYLTEEITFARQNAAKFYGRVLDTLTKRRADD